MDGQVTDTASSLAAKLNALELTPPEAAALAAILRAAEEGSFPELEPLVDVAVVPLEVQQAIVGRTARALGCDVAAAAAAFADALEFLRACGCRYEVALSPSAKVDEAWHQFLLFTAEYSRFCETTVGQFIHHAPNVGRNSWVRSALPPPETFAFLTARGHHLDPALWSRPTLADALARL